MLIAPIHCPPRLSARSERGGGDVVEMNISTELPATSSAPFDTSSRARKWRGTRRRSPSRCAAFSGSAIEIGVVEAVEKVEVCMREEDDVTAAVRSDGIKAPKA